MTQIAHALAQLQEIQSEYAELIREGTQELEMGDYSLSLCSCFLDEVKGFWLEKSEILQVSWPHIMDNLDCFILSAATNLDVARNGHFAFRAVGHVRLLYDPFLKLEHFCRVPKGVVKPMGVQEKFREIARDTMSIVTNFSSDFFFFDLAAISGESQSDRMDLVNKKFSEFLPSLFGKVEMTEADLVQMFPT